MSAPGEAGPAPRPKAIAVAIDADLESTIAAYLESHPDFLQRHPALLRRMTPPALQGDLGRVTHEKSALIHNARANANGQSRMHAAVLALIEAESLGQLIETLTGDLIDLLDVDVIAMVVESNGADLPHVAASGIRIVEPGSITAWVGRRDVVLRGGVVGDPAIYGPGAGLIQSEALLRLDISRHTPAGLVAFGSRNPDLFQDGQGTELIAFLGDVLERLLRAWLEIPG
jgi:uncharacterized protein YigA (DUF484 family)